MGCYFMRKGKTNKRSTVEFMQMAAETMRKEGLRYKEAERQSELPHMRAAAWKRIYLEEEPEGLYIERRGHGSKGRPKAKG